MRRLSKNWIKTCGHPDETLKIGLAEHHPEHPESESESESESEAVK